MLSRDGKSSMDQISNSWWPETWQRPLNWLRNKCRRLYRENTPGRGRICGLYFHVRGWLGLFWSSHAGLAADPRRPAQTLIRGRLGRRSIAIALRARKSFFREAMTVFIRAGRPDKRLQQLSASVCVRLRLIVFPRSGWIIYDLGLLMYIWSGI